MKKLHVIINGVSPLIMHSPKCVNPLHPIAKEMKTYTSKKKKTEDDLQTISDLEWLSGVYWDDNTGLYIPNEALAATFLAGAKMNKNGTALQKYVQVIDSVVPLDIGEVQDLDKIKIDPRFRDVRSVVVNRARVVRTRPRFNTWRAEFDMLFDETKIDSDVISMAIENAGSYCGLLEMRNRGYGRFSANVNEIEMAA